MTTSIIFSNFTNIVLYGNNETREIHNVPTTLKTISDIVITSTLVIIMLGMGCTIEFSKLLEHLRRPIAAIIGMSAQFIALPLMTFCLAHALQLEPLVAIGMLVLSCCPGGATSNMFSYWADGDVPLSVTMTSLSTLLCLCMMPLNMWLYSRSWNSESVVIPYVNIFISLAMTIVPAAVGIFIRWKHEKVALFIVKIGSICGAIAVVLTMTLISLLYPFMYRSSWKIYIGAFLLPFLGFASGYLIAKICCLDGIRSRTIALETGIQNFPLSMTLISLSFPKHIIPQMVPIPLLYGVLVLINSCIFVAVYQTMKNYCFNNANVCKTAEFKRVALNDTECNVEVRMVDESKAY